MKILQSQINSNVTSPLIKESKGGVNCVLAVRKDTCYDKSNTYLPKWEVVNTVFYNAHKDSFEGWLELEDIFPPDDLLEDG